jgi:tetratricopeptide (TPR) repeat protein
MYCQILKKRQNPIYLRKFKSLGFSCQLKGAVNLSGSMYQASLNFPFRLSGSMHEAQDLVHHALASYANGLCMDLNHAPSKVSVGALLSKRGPKCLPVSRSFLSDALRLEPTNCAAWYYLGMVHGDDGRPSDAADCFQAAAMLEESDPVERFSMLS